jgi:hypothetical protein
MKNLFIVLLIAVIGAGVYLYFGKKQKHHVVSKELIVGKWAIDSLKGLFTNSPNSQNRSLISAIDSNLKKIEFEFRNDSMVFQIFDEKILDTSHYSFANDKTILMWRNADTAKEKFRISTLDSSKLSFRDNDSVIFYFRRIPIK